MNTGIGLNWRCKAFNKVLNTYLMGDIGEGEAMKAKGRRKTMAFLQNTKKMQGIDLTINGTWVDAPNHWIPIVLNDYEMFTLMQSYGATLTHIYNKPESNMNNLSAMDAIIMFAADIRFFELLPKEYDWNKPIEMKKDDIVTSMLPLQKMIDNYSKNGNKANGKREQLQQSIKYAINQGADLNRNVMDTPSVVMTIVDQDCPEVYEFIPLGKIDRNKKYQVLGKQLTCYEYLMEKQKDSEINPIEAHQKVLQP